MKKIYFVLLLTIFLGFVAGNKASGQPGCENCIAPWSCTTFTLTINCNGVDFPVEYTVCYFCWVDQPRVDAEITRVDGIPIGSNCYWNAREAGVRWILEHGIELCGVLPCEVSMKTFKIYEPVCADLLFNQNGTYSIYLNPECDLKCVREFEWCWCQCVRGICWDDEDCTEGEGYPKVHWRQISNPQLEGSGSCTYNPSQPKPGTRINCQKFKTPCNDDGFGGE
jgi:hypothetical protein